ncbi:alpha/beta hydrolase [Streptomyces albipurpureus]|uniref:Alpha/beta hydrolase n=1 Tax=Streptomyces albipurpureus TaxID=2897419 RepID=A0ABT0UWT4_9ACTN|nr:alpha/beta hydrolase [Streptomyces sp. CWNU-1]MCM2391808.1 alpha/beta hydrolase [Streptomyces sp. CWNU-1]
MRAQRLVPLIAVTVLATLAPALYSVEPASAASPLDRYMKQSPLWKQCAETDQDLECATIEVPLDYREPGGRAIELAVSRLAAGDPTKRRGVLFLNPGGPGAQGLGMPLQMMTAMPESVTGRYDLIGFDPRGVGQSTPLSCRTTEAERQWMRPYKATTYTQQVAWARTIARKCRTESSDRMRYTTTRNTARDMDVIRSVLREQKISYFGYSYGTYLGAVYGQLFPKQADRFVLDSAIDPELIWRGTFQKWASEAEPAFQRWTKWTASHHSAYQLGDTPASVSKTFWDLVAQADRHPIVWGKYSLTGTDIRDLFRGTFFSPRVGAGYIADLKRAAAGEPVPELPELGELPDNAVAVLYALLCGDTRSWPRDPGTYARESRRDAARYPLYGDHPSNISPCAFWTKAIEPATKVNHRGSALILHNEWDSQTPLSTGIAMHKALKGSRLVTVDEGEGHGVYDLSGNVCAESAANDYLVTGRLPTANLICEAPSAQKRTGSLPAPNNPLTPGFH